MSYCVYHLHSDLSLLDSCSKFSEYVDLAKAQGMTAIASTEHGLPRGWVEKKDYCDANGIKFIFGVETYITYDPSVKVRDNMHTILLSRNIEGFHEINRLMGHATQPDMFYFVPRISVDDFLAISPNVIKISACLASPLNRISPTDPRYLEIARHYDYLEVQHHNIPDQIAYNKRLLRLSSQLNIPLIAGTDTHSSSPYKAEGRSLLMRFKEQNYPEENGCDIVWKTYDELIDAYERQGALPRNAFMEAIENTNVMAESVEDWRLDKRPKYPVLYGSPEADEEKLHEVTWKMLDEKIASGVIPKEQEEEFRRDIAEEFDAFHRTNMSGFMLSMHEIVGWCRNTGKPIGPSRGSVSGSRVAYVTEITDLNPVQFHTSFSRFCNKDRTSLADVDVDCIDSDRPEIFRYIISKFGSPKCARVAAYGTIADLSFIDDAGGGLALIWEQEHHPEKFKENGRMDKSKYKFDNKNPYNPLKLQQIKKEYKDNPDAAREKYPDLFYYEKALAGTRISQSIHPAGIVISCEELDDNWGVYMKDGERCLYLDMNEVSMVNLVKYDMLIIKTLQVISDCYKLFHAPYPRMYEINFRDKDVWKSICDDQSGIFQFESDFAADAIKKFMPTSIEEITVVNAALRPGSASYRDDLFARKRKKNPTPLIDEILKDSYGQLVYQEQTIEFLQKVCGLSASYADTIRRAISKKKRDKIDKAMPEILDGYCRNSDKSREQAEEEAKQFLKVIEDSSEYSFNYNHAVGYSLLSYMCAYLRYHHPAEFIASYLKNAANDDDINTGRAMAKSRGIAITKPRFRQDNRTFYISEDGRSISDALSSIKGVGLKDAEALYALRDFSGRFVELLREMSLYSGGLNKTVVEKLIKIDYFHEFGCIKKLLDIYAVFQDKFKPTLAQASQEKVMMELISYESGDENMSIGFLADLFEPSANKWAGVKDDPIDIVRYECEIIGTPITLLPDSKGVYAVLEVDTNYSPKVKMMSLASGNVGTLKVLKKDFFKNELTPGMIFKLDKWEPRPAYGRPGVMDNWMVKYTVI